MWTTLTAVAQEDCISFSQQHCFLLNNFMASPPEDTQELQWCSQTAFSCIFTTSEYREYTANRRATGTSPSPAEMREYCLWAGAGDKWWKETTAVS